VSDATLSISRGRHIQTHACPSHVAGGGTEHCRNVLWLM